MTKRVKASDAKACDVVGFSGRTTLSVAINVATCGIPFYSLSHVGIMGECPDGKLRLFESTTLDGDRPCEILGKPIAGTQAHTLDKLIECYKGSVWLYPLYRPLYAQENERLTQYLMETLGRPYDQDGAVRSAGILFSWIESLFREQDLSTIFCSEHVAGAFATTGLYATDSVSQWNPSRFVRRMRLKHILRRPGRLK
jgi:hypothetical protein